MSITIYVPAEATAVALGANDVAARIAREASVRRLPVHIVRTGSRGLFWLEPLVEVQVGPSRLGFGPVRVSDISSLFDTGFSTGASHSLALGDIGRIPQLARQQRLTCARLGVVDPISVADYVRTGGYQGLTNALQLDPAGILDAVVHSGLRGRGGAPLPTGIKWRTVALAAGEQKYVVCNADEGHSGAFSDRLQLEGDPFSVIEGMTIAALAVNAARGYIDLRCEYPRARQTLNAALAGAYAGGYLGANILGSGRSFDIELRIGAGAHMCGVETSLLESIEGRRGQGRFKPPLPAIKGRVDSPTVVNNVITLASVPVILARGAQYYHDFGQGASRGTLPLQLTGDVARSGLTECAFDMTLNELIYDFGGGSRSGRPVRAVQVGGPLCAYWPPSKFDTALNYEAVAAAGGMLGHGSVVVFDGTGRT